VIAAEATPADNPGEGSLNDPSSGLGTKAFREELLPVNLFALGDEQSPFRDGERLDGLDSPSQRELCPDAEGAAIVAVSPHQPEAGKHLLQWLKQATASCLIGDLGSSHFDRQQVALRINERVAFAAPDFFSPYRSPFRGREPHWF
jgi:hypothetical protein